MSTLHNPLAIEDDGMKVLIQSGVIGRPARFRFREASGLLHNLTVAYKGNDVSAVKPQKGTHAYVILKDDSLFYVASPQAWTRFINTKPLEDVRSIKHLTDDEHRQVMSSIHRTPVPESRW